ncbi:putative barnase/colicin E5 family endoribonuclease, partial [Helicobacter bizzozeronii]|uniref:putative barnase/colicin E5 family endoribonuclease n=1 Tax=Helicobacter bizzozeronii TaxID=56877 RepID=UPI002277AA56
AKRETSTFEQAWLKAFNLESLDQPFIPKFSPAVQQVLEPILKGESIKLTRGSLAKLEKRQREEFLPLIRPTLEEPNAVLKQADGALIFVKDFGGAKFFTSVARGDSGKWVITSNAPKTLNNLHNKISEGGEVLISDLPELPIIAQPVLPAKALNSGANPKESTKPHLKSPNIEPNPAFGEHFKEFEGKGAEAVKKLLKEQRGQVAGAFYREDLGYIDLIWGDSKKGLAHILERRTQQYGEQKALDFINDLPRMLQEAKFYKELENKIELVTPTDMIVLGKRGDNKFVLTSFRDRRSKDRFTELENPQTRDDVGFTGKSVSEPQTKDDVLLPNQANSTKPPLKVPHIEPNPAFGQHFKEFEGKGAQAVAKLLQEKRGQVAGAFYREDLGHIDLVWGNVEGKGNKATGWGLSKILEKHLDDFKGFEGATPLEKLGNGINEIVQRGEVVVQEKKRTTIIYSKDGRLFRVGLKQNWKGEPTENKWIITAYEDVGKP